MEGFIKFIVLCSLVTGSYVFGDNCGNGATCIALTECKGVQSGIQRGERAFRTLFRRLRCGIDTSNGDLMICCPPELLNSDDMNLISPAVSLLPNVSVCGIQYTDRMYWSGNIMAGIDEHSWLALIRYNKPRGSGFYCGGVLISARYVLTAAHCVKGMDLPTNWNVSQVRLGEWNTSSDIDCHVGECAPPVLDVDVEEIIPHSEYISSDSHQHNDIALLRLVKDVSFNEFVKPICLPNSAALRDSTFEGLTLEVAGWSQTGIKSRTDIKFKERVSMVERNICRNVYKRFSREVRETQLCAGGSENGAPCKGDLGGPLMAQIPPLFNWNVIGVESYAASPCGVRGWPAVYTRVTNYLDWIITNMRP